MASKTTATVISLAMLAGGMRTSAAFWNRMVSVSASISKSVLGARLEALGGGVAEPEQQNAGDGHRQASPPRGMLGC